MALTLAAIAFDALDPERLASFWSAVLGDEPGVRLTFEPTQHAKTGQNRIHFDVTSTSWDDQAATVERALDLGGRHVDIGQSPDEEHVVLADPEGNEFCVIEPTNRFLAGCGRIGGVNCDGTQTLGYFWSRALEWPLVWDQDEETAIQSPQGGSKITWSGPPLMPRHGRDRLRFDVAASEPDAELERLQNLGATVVGRAVGGTSLTDPDGNEFRLLSV